MLREQHIWLADVLMCLPLLFLYLGYRPFVEACVDAGEKGEAVKYIPKLADPRERAEVTLQIFDINL